MQSRAKKADGRGVIASLITVLMLVLAACSGGEADPAADGGDATEPADEGAGDSPSDGEDAGEEAEAASEIVVGFSAPYTGQFESVGPALESGVRIALEEMGNEFAGIPVRLVTYDDKNDPAQATAVAQEAIEQDGVSVMIGPAFTGTAAATMQTYTNAGLPQLLIGTATEVTGPDFPYAYRAAYTTDQQAELHIPYLVETLGIENIGGLFVEDALGQGQRDGVVAELEKFGLEATGLEFMNTGDTDVTGQLQRLKEAGSEALFVYASGADAGAVVTSMKTVGLDVPVTGHNGFANAGFRNLTEGVDISQIYATYHCPFTGEPTDAGRTFIEEVSERVYDGGDIVQGIFLQGLMYDATYLIREAVENAGGNVDPASVAEGLSQITDYVGLMGEVDFSESNDGWPVANISVAAMDSWNPTTGGYDAFAPGAEDLCGESQ